MSGGHCLPNTGAGARERGARGGAAGAPPTIFREYRTTRAPMAGGVYSRNVARDVLSTAAHTHTGGTVPDSDATVKKRCEEGTPENHKSPRKPVLSVIRLCAQLRVVFPYHIRVARTRLHRVALTRR